MAVRFAIVGAGGIATMHAQAIDACDGAELVACQTRSVEAGRRFADQVGCEFVPDLDQLVRRPDVDVIVITTPSGTHTEIGVAAAKQGKHVLCEKPLDITLERTDRLIEACRENGVTLGAVFQSRFGPGAQALKRAIEQGRFGRLTQCSAHGMYWRDPSYYANSTWRGTWALDGGGALMNQGIHAIDQLLWLAGGVRQVSARIQTRRHEIEVEDNVTAWLEFASGALGVVQASTASYPGDSRRIDIRGDRGSVTLLDDTPVLWEFDTADPFDAELERIREASVDFGGGASSPNPSGIAGHLAQYDDFVAAIREGRPPSLGAEEGRAAVELVRAIYESSQENRIVTIPSR